MLGSSFHWTLLLTSGKPASTPAPGLTQFTDVYSLADRYFWQNDCWCLLKMEECSQFFISHFVSYSFCCKYNIFKERDLKFQKQFTTREGIIYTIYTFN